MSSLQDRYEAIKATINTTCHALNRDPKSITLIAASKGQSIDKIRSLHALGHRDFGENYVQELVTKAQELAELEIRWHYIGALQSNKFNKVLAHAEVIHTLSRKDHATALAKKCQALGNTPLAVFIAVNIDTEPSKSGCLLEEVPALINHIQSLPDLNLQGIMAIPKKLDPEYSWQPGTMPQSYAVLNELRQRFDLPYLSLGMSHDIVPALSAGSTHLRIGTALMGPRSG